MRIWRPIETAPKDRPVDLWTLINGPLVNCVWSQAEETFTCQDGIPVPPSRITHWRETDKGPEHEDGEVYGHGWAVKTKWNSVPHIFHDQRDAERFAYNEKSEVIKVKYVRDE